MKKALNDSPRQSVRLYVIIALIVLLIAQLGYTAYVYSAEKEGWHMDELWSYGLANSDYTPHLYDRYSVGTGNLYDQWVDGSTFRDYLTVQPGEGFSIGSVWYNQEQDVHPPLYYVLLNAVSSLFPNVFSKWFGFAVNAFALIGSTLLLFLIAKRLTSSDIAALAACAAWGFSVAAIDAFIFIRMYALLTMIVLLSLWLHTRLMTEDKTYRLIPALILTTVAGGLTQYYFYAYAGMMAVCTCIFFIRKKRIRELLAYGFSQLFAVGLAFLLFPAIFEHIFVRETATVGLTDDGKHESIWLQLHFMLRYLLVDCFGIKINLLKSNAGAYALVAVVFLVAVATPLCFLFRKEEWFKKFFNALRQLLKKLGGLAKTAFVKAKDSRRLSIIASAVAASIASFVAVAISAPIYGMQELSVHYYVFAGPIMIALAVWIVYSIIHAIPKTRKFANAAVCLLAAAALIGSNLNSEYHFLFPLENTSETTMQEYCTGADVIIVNAADSTSDYQFLPLNLIDCSRAFDCSLDTIESGASQLDDAGRNGNSIMLLIDLVNLSDNIDVTDETQLLTSDDERESISSGMESNNIMAYAEHNEALDKLRAATRFTEYDYVGYETIYGYGFLMYRLS